MEAIYTIGFTKKPLRDFVAMLRDAKVDVVLDVRRHNTSQLAGFAKRDDLAYILALVGIGYQHLLPLAPDALLLARYRRRELGWEDYAAAYERQLMAADWVAIAALLSPYHQPVLLCAEDGAERCHRRVAADWLAERYSVPVLHLTSIDGGEK